MKSFLVRSGWVSRSSWTLLAILLLSSACTTTAVVSAPSVTEVPAAEDDDFSDLISTLSSDLHRYEARQAPRRTASKPAAQARKERDSEFAARAQALFAPLNGTAMQMPVVGVQPYELTNSWHNARDGGRRKHKGIDIFAPRGTAVVAVTGGIVTYIGVQPKGGQCLWLTTEEGASFYYAHLERWAPGLYEGMEVRAGDVLGYVGNTGNAISTPPHLHFGINQSDVMVNPYPILTRATPVRRARLASESTGSAVGTR